MYTLEFAKSEDAEICYGIIDAAREFQRQQGFVQWTEDYPVLSTIQDDINAAKGYVIKAEGTIAGYMCIDFDGEPAYEQIDGAWNADIPYAVVHRMGFDSAFRGIGLADITFCLIEKLCAEKGVRYIRVDTDFPNKRMQHILEKNGFKKCGIIVFQGSGKIAYDKLLGQVKI